MTPREARKILGLKQDEDPRPRITSLQAERERLAAVVSDTCDLNAAMRHQAKLVAYDQALATLREQGELTETSSRGFWVVSVLIFICVSIATLKAWREWEAKRVELAAFESQLVELEQTGNAHMEKRRWDQAAAVFRELGNLAPDRPQSKIGLARIEAGLAEERAQFIGYWTGEARAALDSGRWEDAESAARTVLERYSDQADAIAVLNDLAAAKATAARQQGISEVMEKLDRSEVEPALEYAKELAANHPNDAELTSLVARAQQRLDQMRADRSRANELFQKAIAADRGTFDPQALEWLREAALLAPEDVAIAAQLEKMASYTRTIRVPEDVAELLDALADARVNDRIVIGPGTWSGTFVVNQPIQLQGSGPAETVLECPAIAGCAITFGPGSEGSRISGVTLRHRGLDPGADRYSAALVRGGAVDFIDCHFIEGSGHGLAVIEGARVSIQRCQFRNQGWNGLAVIGEGSLAKATESVFLENVGHGVEAWDGAEVMLDRCRIEGNVGNAVHLDTPARGNRIEACELVANREFGIVLSRVGAAHISNNRIAKNQLGGVVVRRAADAAELQGNAIQANSGPGLLLDPGVSSARYQKNEIGDNVGGQVVTRSMPADGHSIEDED